MPTILQTYLNDQHIKTTDGSNIESLNKAVAEVKKHLEKRKALIISYTLVALDPLIDEAEPVVKEVEEIIIKKWSTFKNSVTATKDKSATYVRAVILESLSQLAKQDDNIAAIIWHTSRDVISYYQTGKEGNTMNLFLQEVADQTERAGRMIWGLDERIKIDSFQGVEIKIDVAPPAKINLENLTNHLKAAMIHSGWVSSTGAGENPHHQGQNNWHWPLFMAERAGKGITEEVNSALSQYNKSSSLLSNSIKLNLDNYFAQLQPFFEKISNTYANNITANNKRGELIWWKQTLCSPTLNKSYRSYELLESAILMAIDLATQVVPIYPISVDYLLRETLKDVYDEQVDINKPFKEWLENAAKINEPLKKLITINTKEGEGRKALITELANGVLKGTLENFFLKTGIDKNASISAADLSVWIFHGLQAQKIAESK